MKEVGAFASCRPSEGTAVQLSPKLILTSRILWVLAAAAALLTLNMGFDRGPRLISVLVFAAVLVLAFAAKLAQSAAKFPPVFPDDFFTWRGTSGQFSSPSQTDER